MSAKTGTYRRQYGRGHAYYVDGHKVPGVTTLIKGGLPIQLTKWAAETAAGYAIDHWDELAELPLSERYKKISAAPNADRTAAGVRGTRIHKLAEPLAHGEEVAVPEDLRGHVESCVAFLDGYKVRPVLTEAPVFSRRHRYGGSPDLIADVEYPSSQRVLIDWKSNRKGPYSDTAFQLAGYRYAEFYLDDGDQEQPVPEVDACWVVWLRADGYDVYPYHADQHVFRQFLYIAQCAQAAEDSRDYRGDALTPPGGMS